MTGNRGRSRRRLLAEVGGALSVGLGGCADDGASGDDRSPSVDGGSGSEAMTVDPQALDGGGDWPMQNYDVRNCGYAPDRSGPSSTVTKIWEYSLPNTRDPVVFDGVVFAQSADATAVALDATTGEEVWVRELGEANVLRRFATAAAEDYVVAYDGSIYTLDRTSGETIWQREHGTPYKFLLGDGVVYVVEGGGVRILDAASGDELARTDTESRTLDACVHEGRLYTYGHGTVYGFDAATGDELWHHAGPDSDEIGGVIGGVTAADGSVFVTNPAGREALRLDPETGDVVWRRDGQFIEAPVLASGTLYVATARNGLRALDPETGEDRSRWSGDVSRNSFTPPSATSDSVYHLAGRYFDQRLVSLDPKSGAVQWETTTEDKHGVLAVTEDVLVCRGDGGDAVVGLAPPQQ